MSRWKFEPWDIKEMLSSNCTWEQYADILNAKLAEWIAAAPVVYGKYDGLGSPFFSGPGDVEGDTHTARLIMVEEIKKEDTAESLLRELVKAFNGKDDGMAMYDIAERARKLLEGK